MTPEQRQLVDDLPVIRKPNPFWEAHIKREKLKAAREIGRRRAHNKRQKDAYDEFQKVKTRERHRKKAGIPLEAPLMKPWDHVKGKV